MIHSISNNIKKCWDKASGIMKWKKELRFVMIGLEGSGKTTILYRLKFDELVEASPTRGFNVETLKCKRRKITLWDIGSLGGFFFNQSLFRNVDGLVVVVDSANHEKLQEAKDFFRNVILLNNLKFCPVLIYCNKQDTFDTLSMEEMYRTFDLKLLNPKKVHFQPCSAFTGYGLMEGLKWMAKNT